ncbi:uncharacterized protein [Dermacentor albipictus]|uniref:uncharacterized protein isoform X1 n=1 Tax=Dermacentor albipictus TaxID=60249 RepID=UPI0031FD3D58
MITTSRRVDVVVLSLALLGLLQPASSFKDWYFGVEKVPDFRMMAVKPLASVRDSILYTCSAASSDPQALAIRFLINFRNLTDFCMDGLKCKVPPITRSRSNVVRGPLVIYDAQLEFGSTVPVEGTVSCAFENARGDVLANLYGFFNISRHLLPNDVNALPLCVLQQGCRLEESHCAGLNHANCSQCQAGMGFDSFYHLCFDPRQIGQSCVFRHQCTQSDPRSRCELRVCKCQPRHDIKPDGCQPLVGLGYLCGPGTYCSTPQATCVKHACVCPEDHVAVNGTCQAAAAIELKDMLVILTSTAIVFTAFTSLVCILLRDQRPEDEEGNRSRYSLNSIR